MAQGNRGGGVMGKRRGGGASAEARKRLVAEMALKRMSVREIADALAKLPARRRPAACSTSAVGRDLKELRDEWAAARAADVETLVGEEVARLNELERVWWPVALNKDKDATDRVLAIQRQRVQLLRIGPGSGGRVAVEAGAGTAEGERGPVTAVKVRVELVDDWRDA